jgi:hypothetical protein
MNLGPGHINNHAKHNCWKTFAYSVIKLAGTYGYLLV